MVSNHMLKQVADIERSGVAQSRLGGTPKTFATATVICSQIKCSIQSASPTEIENWGKRGVMVTHKVYTNDATVINAKQGDRVKDARYNPVRYLTIMAPPEDMGARGQVWGLFCNYVA
jgi:hypothetical protein